MRALMVAACAFIGADVASAQRLTITEMWSTTGSPDVHQWVFVAGVGEAPDGGIWVSEGMARVGVVRLAAGGRGARVVARPGDGPGEVSDPSRFARTPAGGVAILDMGHRAVQVFDSAGRFVERVPLGVLVMNPKGFAVLRSGEFLITGGIARNPHQLHLFGPDGTLRTSWHPAPRTDDPMAGVMIAGGPVTQARDGSILFSQAAPHALIRFDRPGSAGRVIAEDRDLLPAIGDDFFRHTGSGANRVTRPNWFFPQSRAVCELGDGTLLNVVWFLERGTSLWEIYTPDGGRVARQWIRRAYVPWMLATDGTVLASYRDTETDEHRVARLRIGRP